jgi:hypothetical protein
MGAKALTVLLLFVCNICDIHFNSILLVYTLCRRFASYNFFLCVLSSWILSCDMSFCALYPQIIDRTLITLSLLLRFLHFFLLVQDHDNSLPSVFFFFLKINKVVLFDLVLAFCQGQNKVFDHF